MAPAVVVALGHKEGKVASGSVGHSVLEMTAVFDGGSIADRALAHGRIADWIQTAVEKSILPRRPKSAETELPGAMSKGSM